MSDFLSDSTKEYYKQKIELFYEEIKNKINSNKKDYEAYMNIPFTKSMIKFRFDFDLVHEGLEQNDLIEMIVDEGLNSLLYSSINKIQPTKYRDIYLTEHLTDSSASEIRTYLDYVVDYKFENSTDAQLNKIRYLYFGEKHIRYIDRIVKLNKIEGFVGEYKGIKLFYIENLENIFLSNSAFIDLNTMDVRYNEYIKEEWSDMYDENVLYEDVVDSFKKGVLTLNCFLANINIIKLCCYFGNGTAFYRKLKLSRILKNEIDI